MSHINERRKKALDELRAAHLAASRAPTSQEYFKAMERRAKVVYEVLVDDKYGVFKGEKE